MRARSAAAAVACASALLVGAASLAATTPPTLAACQRLAHTETLVKGQLTVATENPALAPWYIANQPSNKKGYESALAYLIAAKLKFPASSVHWVTEHFADATTPGAKPFDIDLNEIAPSASSAKNVTFSTPYYNVAEALVALRTNAVVRSHTPKALTHYVYGVIAGSPAVAYVRTRIAPVKAVVVLSSLYDARDALRSGRIDAFVTDVPSAYWFTTTIAPSTTAPAIVVARFPATGDLTYAAVLAQKSPLAACVDVAITSITKSGELRKLQTTWLKAYESAPVILP
jgi:polar amino acid transport system substrate-binding protein